MAITAEAKAMLMEAAPPKKPKKNKTAKRFIKSNVIIHDRTQIETVFDYYLFRGGSGLTQIPKPLWHRDGGLRYKVEAYLFYPRQFGLDASSYPKSRFFTDMRPLLRFREPKLGYKAMLGHRPGVTSPLVFLREYINDLASDRACEPLSNALDEVRLFACAFVSTFLRGIDRCRRRLQKQSSTGIGTTAFDPEQRIKNYDRMRRLLVKADKVLQEFRRLRSTADCLPVEVGQALAQELKLIDEYCYYRLRDGLAALLQLAYGDPWRSSETDEFIAVVKALLVAHDAHGSRCGFLRISPESSQEVREKFIHRRGELKRRVWGVLFLEMRALPLFKVQEQMGAMVAAGVAAVWAAVTQLMILIKVMQPQGFMDIWGVSGLVFLIAGALAYIVKDRIKELGRGYFGGRLLRRIPDHAERIYYDNRQGVRMDVGSSRESAKYLTYAMLPERIARMRGTHGSGQEGDDEVIDDVLVYTKEVTLSGRLRILDRYPLRAVHDIMRLSIDACLPRLGEPSRLLNIADEHGQIHALHLPKVYYLDMVLSYSRHDQKGKAQEQALDYFRLILDKNGLLRVERIS